ncbi:MAG: hypothetical protein H7234_07835 [Herminiimonas sp.]|nr:hypothetical protein [Herminiimonas sp.]
MKVIAIFTTLLLAILLAGCSAEQSRGPSPQAMRNVVDPSIPALTITATRMTDSEKLAYDRSLSVKVAGLPTSK